MPLRTEAPRSPDPAASHGEAADGRAGAVRRGLLGDHGPEAEFDVRSEPVGDLLEHGGTLDDDGAAGAEGNRTDDGDGNPEEQRARGGNHQHREKPSRFSTHGPGHEGDRERDQKELEREVRTKLADLPGVSREDLSIGVDGRQLTIEAPLKLGEASSLARPEAAAVRPGMVLLVISALTSRGPDGPGRRPGRRWRRPCR